MTGLYKQLHMTASELDEVVAFCGTNSVLVERLLKARQANMFHPATPEQIEAARSIHESDEIEVDDGAGVSDPEDGSGYWVQAWVWVDTATSD